jgi:type I restriction enzyme M protein
MEQPNLPAFIWSVADLLRGDYKQSEYGKVILPFTVLRRLDCVLEPSKAVVLAEYEAKQWQRVNSEPFQ